MKMNLRKCSYLILVSVLFLSSIDAFAQVLPPYRAEIDDFIQQDSANSPPKNAILFVGSSSIRMWDNLKESFPEHTVINRGFGGSNLVDLHRYVDEIVLPYQPKQIVIYSGENDLAPGDITPDTVLQRFITVFNLIRSKMPKVPIIYISIKPSPSRSHLLHLMITSNRRIQSFLSKQKNAKYIDVFNQMLNSDGKPKPEIFLADSLHMNRQGYAIWQKAIAPHLLK